MLREYLANIENTIVKIRLISMQQLWYESTVCYLWYSRTSQGQRRVLFIELLIKNVIVIFLEAKMYKKTIERNNWDTERFARFVWERVKAVPHKNTQSIEVGMIYARQYWELLVEDKRAKHV